MCLRSEPSDWSQTIIVFGRRGFGWAGRLRYSNAGSGTGFGSINSSKSNSDSGLVGITSPQKIIFKLYLV